MLIDLHVHTKMSPCSTLPVGDILRNARKFGLDGVCITDHDTMAARHEIQPGRQDDGLLVIIGMEYETRDGDFLLFGAPDSLEIGLPAPVMLESVHQAGGAAVAAHPFRKMRPAQEYVLRQGLADAVECLNGRNSMEENAMVDSWTARHSFSRTGGSDAHTLEELGRVVTWFETPINSEQDLVDALLSGRCSPLETERGRRRPLKRFSFAPCSTAL